MVSDQTPKPGISLKKNSVIVLYEEGNTIKTSVTVPDLTGKTEAQASNILKALNLNISTDGSGVIVSQEPSLDTKVEEGSVIKVTLRKASQDTH